MPIFLASVATKFEKSTRGNHSTVIAVGLWVVHGCWSQQKAKKSVTSAYMAIPLLSWIFEWYM